MALSVPSPDEHPTLLADWVEFSALESRPGRAYFAHLTSALDLDQDYEEEDIADRDARAEEIIAAAAEEIARRRDLLGQAYPFQVSGDGDRLILRDKPGLGGIVYIFCLIVSHATRSPILREDQLPDSSHKTRDLFQICATLCAAGDCRGPAVSFGFPRPDRSSFAAKLRNTYERFGEGRTRSQPLPAAPMSPKDDEIDVIAWRDTTNGLAGKSSYLLGQAASGWNWEDKSVKNAIEVFHWTWFEVIPTSTPLPAIFIPFCLEEPRGRDGAFTSQERLRSRMERLTKKFGILYYRYRLPRHAAQAKELADAGIGPIERLDEVHRLEEWVGLFREKLRREP